MGTDEHRLEIVVGDGSMYVPEHAYLNRLFQGLHKSLRRADVTPEDLLADMEAHREETFHELYPGLSEG